MKRSKREENSIIINIVFYIVLFAIILFIVVFYLMPKVQQININKTQTISLSNDLEKIKKEGISYEDFKKIKDKWNNKELLWEILKTIEKDFYNKNFLNENEISYDLFLEKKEEKLNSEESQNKISINNKKISKILPLYSEVWVILWDNDDYLTTFKFINYIESILETFELKTKNPIWISHINILDNYNSYNNQGVVTDSNIYSIPLNLKLSWTKQDILKFLYFIENVWNITVNDDDIILNNKEGILIKNGLIKFLLGDSYWPGYNIFEHQIIDIKNVTFTDYIDSSYENRGEQDLEEFIMNTQWLDDYDLTVSLEFYIKGLPIIEIENYINNVVEKYKKTLGLVITTLKNTKLKGIERIRLTKQEKSLIEIKKEVFWFKKEMNDKTNIEKVYKRSVEINKIISPIYNKLSK
jgi:hypothetical protein